LYKFEGAKKHRLLLEEGTPRSTVGLNQHWKKKQKKQTDREEGCRCWGVRVVVAGNYRIESDKMFGTGKKGGISGMWGSLCKKSLLKERGQHPKEENYTSLE